MPSLPAIDVDSPVTARRVGIGMSVLLCFFCDGEATRCDCGKFDAVTEDPITPDGQRRIDAATARREYLRKNPPAVCVEKSSKGMTCEQISYYCGSRCRSCRLQHNA